MAGRPVHTFTVLRTEPVAPNMMRIVLGGNGFDTFTPIDYTDSYVKVILPGGDAGDAGDAGDGCDGWAGDVAAMPRPLTRDSFDALPQPPVVRTLTVRRADPRRGELHLEIVTHGEQGSAGRWAVTARPGQPVYLMGPAGAYAPDPGADWHLLAGDESALPAIGAALEALPADAVGDVFVEVADAAAEIALDAPDGMTVHWIHRGGRADVIPDDRAGDRAPLIAAVKAAVWRPGRVHVFIHGEAQAVMHNLRPYIRTERGVPAASASISGYWRRGRTEETFRAWKKELAAAEADRAD